MNLLDIVNREVESAILIAESEFNLVNVREKFPLTVQINNKLSRALGHVRWKYKRVNGVRIFTECILEISGRWLAECSELIDTIRHEVAHYIDTIIHERITRHDVLWKMVAIKLGAKPSATAPRPSPDVYRQREVKQPELSPFYCPICAEKFMLDAEKLKRTGMQHKHTTCDAVVIHEVHVNSIANGRLTMIGAKTAAFEKLLDTFRPVVDLPKVAKSTESLVKPVKLGKRKIKLQCSCGHVGVYSARVRLTANLICCPSCLVTGNMNVM